MKLRFYLRGLGIGIIITAVILGIAFRGQKGSMSDEEVIERAKELGMEEKYGPGTLADMQSGSDKTDNADTGETPKDAGGNVSADSKNTENAKAGKTENPADSTGSDKTEIAKTGETEKIAATAESTDSGKTENLSDDSGAKSDTAADDKEDKAVTADNKESNTDAAADDEGKEEAVSDSKTDKAGSTGSDKTEAVKTGEAEKKADSNEAADSKKTGNAETGKTETPAESADADKAEKPAPGSDTRFVISGGQGSETVAKNLEKAGIIKDAAAFDAFLCSKGYDKKLGAGEHIIPAGADDEQIAQALMRSID